MLSCESCLHGKVCKWRESAEALLMAAIELAGKDEMKSGAFTISLKCKYQINNQNNTGTR